MVKTETSSEVCYRDAVCQVTYEKSGKLYVDIENGDHYKVNTVLVGENLRQLEKIYEMIGDLIDNCKVAARSELKPLKPPEWRS
jgi:acetolactate synthase small subunit